MTVLPPEADRNFATYYLGDNPAELAGGVVRDIAEAVDVTLDQYPTEDQLRTLIGAVGKNKELQNNIGQVSDRLKTDATTVMADWVEQSGVLLPMERAFADPSIPIPKKVGSVVVQADVVVNWLLRRKGQAEKLDPEAVGELLLVVGTRKVKPQEHPLASAIIRAGRQKAGLPEEGDEPKPTTEEEKKKQRQERAKYYPSAAEFLRTLRVVEGLAAAGFNAALIEADSDKGSEVLEELVSQRPGLLADTVMVIGNAPATIQAAGQVLDAARRADQAFNGNGDQLFMRGDAIEIARHGEGPATHQNPETALGQIVRNAKYIPNYRAAA